MCYDYLRVKYAILLPLRPPTTPGYATRKDIQDAASDQRHESKPATPLSPRPAAIKS